MTKAQKRRPVTILSVTKPIDPLVGPLIQEFIG